MKAAITKARRWTQSVIAAGKGNWVWMKRINLPIGCAVQSAAAGRGQRCTSIPSWWGFRCTVPSAKRKSEWPWHNWKWYWATSQTLKAQSLLPTDVRMQALFCSAAYLISAAAFDLTAPRKDWTTGIRAAASCSEQSSIKNRSWLTDGFLISMPG